MTKQEIKLDLEQGTYFYNDNETWVLDFWEEAAKKAPKLVEQDFKNLNNYLKTDEYINDLFDGDFDGGFKLNNTYKKMFKDLNLN